MTNSVQLTLRDQALLRLLSWTPATTSLLLRASRAFNGGPFIDERRLRERLQALGQAGFTRHWQAALSGGGLQNYYKLTPAGFQTLVGTDVPMPPRAFFMAIAPSHFAHTMKLADVIVTTLCAAFEQRIEIVRYYRENELAFPVGDDQVQPDCFIRFATSGRIFNVAYEIDQGTETIDSPFDHSLRHRLDLYDAYQDQLLRSWAAGDRSWERPRFRVVYLTTGIERAYHILGIAAAVARVRSRQLVLAASQDAYLGAVSPLSTPLFIDHRGAPQSLIDLHPTSTKHRNFVRIPTIVRSPEVW